MRKNVSESGVIKTKKKQPASCAAILLILHNRASGGKFREELEVLVDSGAATYMELVFLSLLKCEAAWTEEELNII